MPTAKTTRKTGKTKPRKRKAPGVRKSTRKAVSATLDRRLDLPASAEIPPVTCRTARGVPLPAASIREISSNISGMDAKSLDRERMSVSSGVFDINRKVLARIALLAAGEIEGLVPPKRDPIHKIVDSISGRTDGIRVDIGATEAAVDMLIRVRYGTHIPDVTTRLREKVAQRIQEMTGLKVVEINVRVQDITLPGQSDPHT